MLSTVVNAGAPGQVLVRVTMTAQRATTATVTTIVYPAGTTATPTASREFTGSAGTYVAEFTLPPGQLYDILATEQAPGGSTFGPEDTVWTYNFLTVTTPPSAITLSGSISNRTVSLSWPTSQGATGYRLYRDGAFLLDTTALSYTEVRSLGVFTNYSVQPFTDNAAGRTYATVSNTVGLQANSSPTAPTPTDPVGNGSRDRTLPIRLSATFNDPDATASVSSSSWRYRIAPAAFTTITQANGLRFTDIPAGLVAGAYEWDVLYFDQFGDPSPRSRTEFFTAANVPAGPVITEPAAITSSTATLVWTTVAQDAYEVRKLADDLGLPADGTVPANVLFTSGVVEAPLTRSLALSFPVNSRFEHLQVRVRVAGLFGPFTTVRRQVSYTTPAVPVVALTLQPAFASILVSSTNPTPTGGQPSVVVQHVFRREGAMGDGFRLKDFTLGGPLLLSPGNAVTDRTVAHGVDYGYRVQSLAANGTATYSLWVDVAGTPAVVVGNGGDFVDADFIAADFI